MTALLKKIGFFCVMSQAGNRKSFVRISVYLKSSEIQVIAADTSEIATFLINKYERILIITLSTNNQVKVAATHMPPIIPYFVY